MFAEDNSIPRGSPLGPFGASRTPRGLPVPPPYISRASFSADEGYEDGPAPQAFERPGALQLPKMPPSAKRRATPWDKEHISETLLGIGAGFLSSRDFGEGMGNAAKAIGGRMRDIRTESRKSVEYGGPGDQFEITTDAYGNKTVREVPQFRAANERAAKQKNAMAPKDEAELRARAFYAIATQVPPDQRQAEYQRLLSNPAAYGVNTTGLPAQWDDRFGTVAGMMGLSVNDALSNERANNVAKETARHNLAEETLGGRRADISQQNANQGAERNQISRQKAAATAKPKARVNKITRGAAMGGYVYQGGDPADQRNWKAQ